jgi:hypothetical protein
LGLCRGTSIDDVSQGEQFDFYNHQQVLRNTEYFDGKPKRFIHYTTLDVLFNVLNSKELRFYNLKALNDGQELNYAINELGLKINEPQINHFKTSLFVHSLCEYNDDDDFNMWRLYGRNGNGVGIIYEITNVDDKWYQFFLGKVIYDTNSESSKLLKAFIAYHNSFVIEHPSFSDNIPTIIPTFLLFHKNSIWSVEKEYRMFIYLSYDKDFLDVHDLSANFYFEDYLCHSIGSDRKENAYLRMPLLPFTTNDFAKYRSNNDEKFLKTIPNINIVKIILGYNYTEKDVEEIGYLIYRLSNKVFRKPIITEQSKLSKYL